MVEQALAAIGQEGRLAVLAVMRAWPRAVGPFVASRATPLGLHEGTLTVGVAGSAWMNQLHLFRDDIAAKVNGCLGREEVTAVKLVLHRDKARPVLPRRRHGSKRAATPDDRRLVDEATAPVTDDQLREALRRIFTRQLESGDAG